ncbi:hypothetical protein [Caulobacter sp. S45]|nr:hypothetical protein [Caulobacter sp. S45]
MPSFPKVPRDRFRKVLVEVGGLFGVLFLALSVFDWLQDSLALG